MSSPFVFPMCFWPMGKAGFGRGGVTGGFYYGVVLILDSGSVKGLYTTDPFHAPKPNFVERKSHNKKSPPNQFFEFPIDRPRTGEVGGGVSWGGGELGGFHFGFFGILF